MPQGDGSTSRFIPSSSTHQLRWQPIPASDSDDDSVTSATARFTASIAAVLAGKPALDLDRLQRAKDTGISRRRLCCEICVAHHKQQSRVPPAETTAGFYSIKQWWFSNNLAPTASFDSALHHASRAKAIPHAPAPSSPFATTGRPRHGRFAPSQLVSGLRQPVSDGEWKFWDLPGHPQAPHSRKSSHSSVQLGSGTARGRRESGGARAKSVLAKDELAFGQTFSPTPLKTTSSPSGPAPFPAVSAVPVAAAAAPKSRRVRTGCLTCRERHLKCDEGTPDCLNCRKGNRECKRGLRLNFIDIQTMPIPFVPQITEWNVSFLDESRLIASEYAGGLGRYPRVKDPIPAPPRLSVDSSAAAKRRRSSATVGYPNISDDTYEASSAAQPPMPINPASLTATQRQKHSSHHQSPSSSGAFFRPDNNDTFDPYAPKDEAGEKRHAYLASDASSVASSMVPQGVGGPSSVASFQAEVGNSPEDESPRVAVRHGAVIGNTGHLNDPMPEGLPTPPSEKMGLLRSVGAGSHGGRSLDAGGSSACGGFEDIYNLGSSGSNGEREYLNSADEVLFMQVFVEEVGVWMDSLDRDKHFSRIIPFVALKSPMMLNAYLACGVKQLTLVNKAYKDDKALFYYDTATTQLLRSLQNPDRDIVECATTAVVLNVYEIMSEKPNERMSHIAGARALIRECGWDARSKGIGAACFWLNIGMEVLSCLAFNWPTAWDPDQWGLDTSFANHTTDKNTSDGGSSQSRREGKQPDSKGGSGAHGDKPNFKPEPTATATALETVSNASDEEVWVHRIFYIVAKIANFRANVAPLHEPSPHEEQARRQSRFEEWKQLKRLCANWNRDCPRSMRPFSYLFPVQNTSSGSIFPNIWLIKRTAVIGRLFYHTAMVLLHQVNPDEPHNSTGNLNAQRHHAHQVCGIVAHTKDHGVASVAIRSLAISAYVLRDPREQDEVVTLLRKITAETGWRIGRICAELQQIWGREIKDTAGNPLSGTSVIALSSSPSTLLPPPIGLPPPTSMLTHGYTHTGQGSTMLGSAGSSFSAPAPLLHKTSADVAAIPTSSGSRRSMSGGTTYPHQLQTVTSVSSSTNTSASVAATVPSSIHSSPSLSLLMPYRPPQMVNPLMHADFSLPDHPYKAFYKPPNESAHSSAQPF